MAPFMRERRQGLVIIVVIEQQIRMNVVCRRVHIGAGSFATLRINMHPALVDRLALHINPVIAEHCHSIERYFLARLDIEFFIKRNQRWIDVVIAHLVDTKHTSAQFEVAMQGRQRIVYLTDKRAVNFWR